VVARLEDERSILITKAVSWSLRTLIARHREAVVAYLARHEATLPKVALRETRMKLATGVKSRRPARGAARA
jgi:3-methyladenine DNA glycosylase AlkD